MGEALVTWHNELVKPQDHVYNLGDVTLDRGGKSQWEIWKRRISQFHGHKRLFLGNHDHFHVDYYSEVFEKVFGTWRHENLLFSHIPIHPTSMGSARANIHGHIHDHVSPKPAVWTGFNDKPTPPKIQPYINVCVEWTEYRPIHLDEVNARVSHAIKIYEEELNASKDSGVQA